MSISSVDMVTSSGSLAEQSASVNDGATRSVPRHRIQRTDPCDLLLLPIVLIGGCLIIFARSPVVIIHPQLWAEDGTVFFQSAYNLGWHAQLFEPQVGYLQTFSRLVADIGLLLPLTWVPALFATTALIVQVLPAVLLSSSRYAMAVPDYRVRLVLAGAYLLIPNSSEVNVDLTNTQWHLAVLATLVVLARPATGAWRVFDIGVVVLSGLTGPFILSLVVVMVVVYVYRRERWTLVLGGLALACAAVQAFELLTVQRPPVGPLGANTQRLLELVGGRVIGATVFGSRTSVSPWFANHLLQWSTVIAIGGIVIIGLAVWRGPFELKMFNLWAGLALAGSLASPLASTHGLQWPALIGDLGARYWLFPSLAFVADVIWLVGQVRWSRIAASSATIVLIIIVIFGVREDFRYPTISAPSWPVQVHKFLQRAPGQSYVFQIRPPGWSMRLQRKP